MHNNIPKHIAIIMDGNGRWAREKSLPRIAGHKRGIDRVKEIITYANDSGVGVLTLFAFSTENWSRPKNEVNMLLRYFKEFLSREIKGMLKRNIKFRVIGRRKPLPRDLVAKIEEAEDKTSKNTGMTLVIAANYGARQEIVDAVKEITRAVVEGGIKAEDIDENNFGEYLYTAGLADPDFLIRTSGEERISNFLLWQVSYAEFYFVKKCWPDFGKKDLEDAILEFQRRQRRFGAI